ncbi:MAG: hypothetical protein QOE97_1278 [Pseudonocardiales bacterium]|nr:hypothetical protein [Pseudonocardiales bacterium]
MIDYSDIAGFVTTPRVTGLALSADGSRLVASAQHVDAEASRYVSALWEIDLDGGPPRRLTWSDKGESAPAFCPDGSLVFVSARPDRDGAQDEPALWRLPTGAEPAVAVRSPGGVGAPVVAAASGVIVVTGSRLVGAGDAADDAERRGARKQRKVSAILHTGMPIRQWDHELGDESPRLLAAGPDVSEPRDLTPDAGFALVEAACSLSADGTLLATTWRQRERGGRMPYSIALIDVGTGERRVLASAAGVQYEGPVISPDGSRVALTGDDEGDFDTPFTRTLEIRPTGEGQALTVDLGDLYPTEYAWAPDSATLYVTGDWRGRGQVVAVEAATGRVVRRLVADAAYAALKPAPDGRSVYALRSAPDEASVPVRLDVEVEDQQVQRLAGVTPVGELPGSVIEVTADVDGAPVRGWLCRPHGDGPAPLMLWIHGGPFMSSNSWSWRWNPWVAVARGYAVLMPDPALSTGYGTEWIARAWPHRAAEVWRDLETLLDEVIRRPEIDAARTACLGGSFGGYMTNWIAGHTERFDAIVTHAGLWALDQQHTTTDAAYWKSRLFGTPADHPEWYAQNSPHLFADRIATPMLVIHGNRDYRVPISEALRLWWDLVSRFDGPPAELPHRFLQLTGENHWVLSPANAEIWYETVLAFCDRHVLGR